MGGIGETMAAWAQAGTDSWDRLGQTDWHGAGAEQEQERVLARVSRPHTGAGAGRGRQGPARRTDD
jgi:hypothetical protein